jgi:hypothetical protein
MGLALLLISLLVLPRYFGVEGVAFSYVIAYCAFVVAAIACMRKVEVTHA